MSKIFNDQVKFVCNVCGVRSPQPILCTKDGCQTPILVHGVGSVKVH